MIPPGVKTLWDALAQRHQLDPAKPAASAFQAFNRIPDELRRQLADLEAEHAALLRGWQEEDQALSTLGQRPVCSECGTEQLEHFYTSQRDARTLCESCFLKRRR